jgi:hypothetical protein
MNDFSPKRAGEKEVFAVDFGPLLPAGVTIETAVWTITSIDTPDPAAAAMIVGDPVISGSIVSQMIDGGVPGTRYAPICTATTSDGQTLILPEYGYGYLDVTL